VYDNAQNVHNTKIEESSLNVIRFLLNVDSGKTDLEGVLKEIEGEVEGCSQEKKDRIKVSLNRLVIDRSYYHNTSLSTILIKVWSYIEAKKEEDQKKELKKRLLEELDEMSGTCSSGFLLRLLNTLSGFEDQATLSISFEDQIVSNFVGRLNGYAKKIGESTSVFYEKERLKEVVKLVKGGGGEGKDVVVDEMTFEEKEKVVTEFGENVLMELCEDTSQWGKRTNFLLFFRTYLPVLQKELYEEFKSYLTDSEIDLYIRKAISTYEGVKFMT
jgi:predicted house-cleaning noncanonical NTP pyrophosphatase (MazG superfamily)